MSEEQFRERLIAILTVFVAGVFAAVIGAGVGAFIGWIAENATRGIR